MKHEVKLEMKPDINMHGECCNFNQSSHQLESQYDYFEAGNDLIRDGCR
jgi:hypothetical protein